ncbi:MAG: hypothetical protein ACXQTV_01555 [Candidatus Hecatellaceae archaeon]
MPSPRSLKISTATLLGVVVFLSKMVLPTPLDKLIIVVQGLMLTLGFLLIGRLGASYVALIGGLLTTVWRPTFTPFTLLFALTYGVLVDLTLTAFKVTAGKTVKPGRCIAALTLSTALIGLISMHVTVLLGLMPAAPTLYLAIIVLGTLNGSLAGYLASILWNKYLIHRFG